MRRLLFFIAYVIMVIPAGARTFYVAPNGQNDNLGTSQQEAFKTLRRAIVATVQVLARGRGNVFIRISPGNYAGEQIKLQRTRKDSNIYIQGTERNSPPVFDGKGGNIFFLVNNPSDTDKRTNIHFSNLEIRNYAFGIRLGNHKSRSQVTHNSVQRVTFRNIGEKYSRHRSVAALGLNRSSNNRIIGNIFINNINSKIDVTKRSNTKRYGPTLFHSIYVSTYSSNNEIRGNRFSNFSGDPIRVRNYSNANVVSQNTFENPASPDLHAMSEWYCNSGVASCAASKEKAENYSYENMFKYNILKDGIKGYVIRNRTLRRHTTKATCSLTNSCRRPRGKRTRFRAEKNIEIRKGPVCKITLISGQCPTFGFLKKNVAVPDYLSKTSHFNEGDCSRRAKTYYSSCYRRHAIIDGRPNPLKFKASFSR